MKIEGSTFIITGGTGGIGGATAKMLAASGASVALFDVVPTETGEQFAAEVVSVTRTQCQALYFLVDITDSDTVRDAVAKVAEKLGNLKGVVHCAGVAIKRQWTNDVAESIPNFKKVCSVPGSSGKDLWLTRCRCLT
jgi:NAD(P)-dependent dehydrogenase (short-subunit alcohol dehydrogenase family)